MTKRIILAYLGAIGLAVLFLPVAIKYSMGGHSLMYVFFYSSPLGLLAALSYSDVKQQFKTRAIIFRSISNLIVFLLTFVLFSYLSELNFLLFLKSQGWILIVLLAPLITALTTNEILSSQIKKENK